MDSSPSSTASSSSSSPVHHASLVDPATHSPEVLELIDIKISRPVIEYVIDCVVETVDFAMGRPTPSSSRGRALSKRPENTKFTTFVNNVITRAEITTSTLLAALVYVNRARPHLHIALEEWALERVFLGALIVASKYVNDSTLKNVHWALCTGVFGKRDVGRIEREFLDVLNFELGIAESDLMGHHAGLSAVTQTHHLHRRSALLEEFGQHHPHHSRAHHHTAVPELEPSSPESSSTGSTSPRTPSTADTSPIPIKKPSVVVAAPPVPPPQKKSFHATTMELLRSFPLPIPSHHHHHSHSHARDSGQDHSQLSIRLSA